MASHVSRILHHNITTTLDGILQHNLTIVGETSIPAKAEEVDFRTFIEYKIAIILFKFGPPVLLFVGTVGNVLSVMVLSRKTMTQSNTSLYLRFLALFDFIVLYTGLLRQWILYLINVDIRRLHPAICKLHTWSLYFSVHTSAWLLVALTSERLFSVLFPHTVKLRCTKRSARVIIGVLILFLAFINAHYFYGIGDYVVKTGNKTKIFPCEGITDDYFYFETLIWPWVDMCLYSLCPSLILIVSNIAIIAKVFWSRRKAKENDAFQGESSISRRNQSSMTVTLVFVSATYVICTTPFAAYAIYTNIHSRGIPPYESAVRELLWAIANLLEYTNNAVNFILYCLSGSRFRQELKDMFTRVKFKQSRVSTLSSSMLNRSSTAVSSVL